MGEIEIAIANGRLIYFKLTLCLLTITSLFIRVFEWKFSLIWHPAPPKLLKSVVHLTLMLDAAHSDSTVLAQSDRNLMVFDVRNILMFISNGGVLMRYFK